MSFSLVQDDRYPRIQSTLLNDDGTPIGLTGATVEFTYLNLATGVNYVVPGDVIDSGAGLVGYTWGESDTAVAGRYVGQWRITYPDTNFLTAPTIPEDFTIFPKLTTVTGTLIANLRPFVRTILGDTDPLVRQFHADQIDDAIRLVVNLDKAPGIEVSDDGSYLTPAVTPSNSQSTNWAKIVLHAARRFILPISMSSSFRTRAFSESFGENRTMVFELLQEIYELEFEVGGE
jgi:hypothetical protein